jgi:hypothetical protein
VKLNIGDFHSTPTLSRDNCTRSFGIKVQNQGTEEPKPERVSKEILQKYLKLIKPLYVKVSKRYNDMMEFKVQFFTAKDRLTQEVIFYLGF